MSLFRVQNNRARQQVDLQPYGNTISVEATSDNPFEDAQDVEVVTQASGGMGGPDPKMRSRSIITKPSRERLVFAGRAKAHKVVAPAHRSHGGFMPGMAGFGADPVVLGPPSPAPAPGTFDTVANSINSLAQTAGGIVGQRYSAQAEAARAAQAQANAQAEQARTERMSAMTMLNNMGQHKAISGTFIAVAAVAAVVGVVMFMKKKGRK